MGTFSEYTRNVVDRGTIKWWQELTKEHGLSWFLRERDRPYAEVDRWWREKYAARPKFEKGRLEKKEDFEKRKKE
jgi:hypothetical protein